MKKLIYLFSIAFLILQSCSPDSSKNSENVDNTLLLRKWYSVSQTSGGKTYIHKACSNGNRDYFEFITPNIANFYHWNNTTDCSYVKESFTWTRTGDIIKLNFGGNISTLTISELSATRFIYVETPMDGSSSSKYVFSSY